MYDKNGRDVGVGDEVAVDEPGASDMHQHAFRGLVVDVHPDDGTLCVTDQDNDCFDVDGNKVTLVEG